VLMCQHWDEVFFLVIICWYMSILLAFLESFTCGVGGCRQPPSAEATASAQCASPTELKIMMSS